MKVLAREHGCHPSKPAFAPSKGCRGGQRHRSSSRRIQDPAPGSCCGETEAKPVQVSAPPRARPPSAFLCSLWPTTWLITYCFVTKSLKWYLREHNRPALAPGSVLPTERTAFGGSWENDNGQGGSICAMLLKPKREQRWSGRGKHLYSLRPGI